MRLLLLLTAGMVCFAQQSRSTPLKAIASQSTEVSTSDSVTLSGPKATSKVINASATKKDSTKKKKKSRPDASDKSITESAVKTRSKSDNMDNAVILPTSTKDELHKKKTDNYKEGAQSSDKDGAKMTNKDDVKVTAIAKSPSHNGHRLQLGVKGGEIEFVYEAPAGRPRGLVFLAHGCGRSALDWWPKGPDCEQCIGLPIEHNMVGSILSNGFAALAVSSHAQGNGGCWNPKYDNARVARAIKKVRKLVGGGQYIPFFAIGVSSGGYLVSGLPRVLNVSALCVISSRPDIGDVNRFGYPPSQWIVFHKDVNMVHEVNMTVSMLKYYGFDSHILAVKPAKVTKSYFSENIENFPLALSTKIVEKLTTAKLIDEKGYLKQNPKLSYWRKVLASIQDDILISTGDDFTPNKSGISEILNEAFGESEVTDYFINSTISFFNKFISNRRVPRPPVAETSVAKNISLGAAK